MAVTRSQVQLSVVHWRSGFKIRAHVRSHPDHFPFLSHQQAVYRETIQKKKVDKSSFSNITLINNYLYNHWISRAGKFTIYRIQTIIQPLPILWYNLYKRYMIAYLLFVYFIIKWNCANSINLFVLNIIFVVNFVNSIVKFINISKKNTNRQIFYIFLGNV